MISHAKTSLRAAWLAALMATAVGVGMVDAAAAQQPAQGNSAIGPDALRDFSIQPQRRIVTQPTPPATPPAATPPPSVRAPTAQPPAVLPPVNGARTVPNPAPLPRPAPQPVLRAPVTAAPPPQSRVAPSPRTEAAPAPPTASEPGTAAPRPVEPTEAPIAAPPVAPSDGLPLWLYGAGAALLVLIGILFLRRRRDAHLALADPAEDEIEDTHKHAVPQPSLPRVPRPDPVPRPWIELDLLAERATADAQESVVEFALTIRNSGGSAARNLKLQAKLICGTLQQDEEIAAFQRKKPGEHRTISLPDLAAGEEITIQGRVDSKGDELKALRVEQKLLFIPLVVVNAHYDWNSARSGQTSKSFLVGREKPDPAERMAPFRLDLGPRVYRTVGQRPYKIEKRV